MKGFEDILAAVAPDVDLEGVFRASELEGIDPPPREWHVNDLVPGRAVTMFGGDGGTGKSLLALQLAIATASATKWIGMDVKSGPCLYLSAEDDKDELHRRISDICAAGGIAYHKLHELIMLPKAGDDALLATLHQKSNQLFATDLLVEIDRYLGAARPALLCLDTLADLHSGNENDRTHARQFVSILRSLALKHKCAVVVLAHPSLTGMGSGSGLSGSTAWNASVRSRLYLERVIEDGQESDHCRRRLVVKKANYGPVGTEFMLRWENGAFGLEGGTSGLDASAASMKAERVFLKLLRSYLEDGRHVSANPGPTYAPAVFATHPKSEGVTKSMLKRAMEALFERKAIHVQTHGKGAKTRSHIEVIDG